MKFVPNLSKASPQLEAGQYYEATLVKVEACVSNARTECVRTHYQISQGEFKGCPISVVTPVMGKGARFFVELARAFDPKYMGGEFDFTAHIGKPVLLEVSVVTGASGLRSYQKTFPRHPDTAPASAPMGETND